MKRSALMIGCIVLLLSGSAVSAAPETGTASFYTKKSCKREGTSGIMANGKELKDEAFTCASWFYPLGTRLVVVRSGYKVRVAVMVTDRGPNKELFGRGRIIDLSEAAFKRLAPLREGIIKVRVERTS